MLIKKIVVIGDSGNEYDVDMTDAGAIRCACPAYTFSSETPRMCKHIEFLAESIGLD